MAMTESNIDTASGEGTKDARDSVGTNEAVESALRGDALVGAERKASPEHADYERSRNPDAELHLDGEDDSLYSDGLDVGGDTETYAGTDGDSLPGMKG
jgi:hypothetical protein